ncbi:Protein of unknown function [Pyronema omphalodes CBS 100304]|uniref:Uncharacterized protein n=1 Tax=Pyronema omphalodes (strain CBS 100304) TaxID=1076935 RepID=U4L7R7_PYROM|nr:Protein of unknown function [Pyronema omphalodes CBS 100304]
MKLRNFCRPNAKFFHGAIQSIYPSKPTRHLCKQFGISFRRRLRERLPTGSANHSPLTQAKPLARTPMLSLRLNTTPRLVPQSGQKFQSQRMP